MNKKSKSLKEEDYLNLLLTILKNMEKNYSVALTEASNENLYETYYSMFEKISLMQRKTYEAMYNEGWYPMEPTDENKINDKYTMLSNQYEDL